ncbi:MAG: 50S ribosomal protein L7/L12 [Endomicrobiales bacterium]|nr:50S ribosomal protein L7/L12 [Endomicrobiales bacterium]
MTKEQIMDAISGMTVMEISDLVKAMEEKFGVTAAVPVGVMAGAGGQQAGSAGPAETQEQTEFTVILKSFSEGKKIPLIKEVKTITKLGLKEAKELVEAGGKAIKEDIPKEEAEKIKERLEAAGGVVELK